MRNPSQRAESQAGKSLSLYAYALGFALLLATLVALPSLSAIPGESAELRSSRVQESPSKTPSPPDLNLAKGRFLIASRDMRDPRFSETVILLVDYGPLGATGLIINRPTEARLSSALPEMEGLTQRTDILFFGGPVGMDKMFLLIRSDTQPDESHPVLRDVYVSTSESTLRGLIENTDAKKKFRLYVGYAGWSPQQLDREVMAGGWHVRQADAETVFDKESSKIWQELIFQTPTQWVRLPWISVTSKAAY